MKRIKWNNNKGIRVLTDAGYKDFVGVAIMGRKQMYKISFTNDTHIEVTSKHAFFTDMLDPITCCDLASGDVLYGREVDLVVSNIEKTTIEDAYDLIEVAGDDKGNHRYFTNGILSHNCEFISSDALLVNSAILQILYKDAEQIEFTEINDFKFWHQIKQGERYLVGVDPSTGSGSDFSIINVVHFPSMVQVAEYRENTMSSPEVYRKLKWVINLMERVGSQCYFTIENNGVGEGLIALYMNDENPPAFAEFVTDGGARMGMNTNGRTKITSCVNFKEMVEGNKIKINSLMALTELKSFVRRKGSYEAQEGSTDDCIASFLLITRILEEISSYEQDAFDKLYSYDEQSYNDTTEYDEQDPDAAPTGMLF